MPFSLNQIISGNFTVPATPTTLPSGTTTPSVSSSSAVKAFRTNNQTTTYISSFSGGPQPGQIIVFYGGDAGNTVFQSSLTLKLSSDVSHTLQDGCTIAFIGDASGNALELSRTPYAATSGISTTTPPLDAGISTSVTFTSTYDSGGSVVSTVDSSFDGGDALSQWDSTGSTVSNLGSFDGGDALSP